MTTEPDVLDLLSDVDAYLCALHVHAARHDQIGADFTCGGCLLRERIAAALPVLAAVPVPPPTDQTALRDRIAAEARTVRLRLGPNAIAMAQRGEPVILNLNEADDLADAVLAVLPEPTDRAAVLREAAEAVAKEREKTDVNVAVYPRWDARQKLALSAAESLLRRLAAEAQPTTKPETLRPTFGTRSSDATVDPAMCPRCKGDNQEAFELCANCAAGVGQDGAQPQEPPRG